MSGLKRPATSFRDAVVQQIATASTRQIGENGMAELSTFGVGSTVLALSQMVRGGDPSSLVQEILRRGSPNEIADLVILLFSTRNTRGGKGEKKLAHDGFLCVSREFPETCARLLPLFPQYGYWKDLPLLMASGLSEDLNRAALEAIKNQLLEDLKAVEQHKTELRETFDEEELKVLQRKGPSISLLAKWLPREDSSLDKKTGFVNLFAPILWKESAAMENTDGWQSKAKAHYRKTIASLTAYLDLPEVLLAAQREEEIKFQRVASKATMRLRKVFLNQDAHGKPRSENPKRIRLAERFQAFVVKKGLKGRQLDPHEIVRAIMNKSHISAEEELVLDAQWKDLWRGVVEQAEAATGEAAFNPTRVVPMADVSGSMYGVPMEVSIALSIGLSEITHEAFRNMVMTFSSQPTWHRLNPGDSIVKKVRSLSRAPWGMSTNFEAAYDLILATAEAAKLSREDLPTLVVFSDMQFDQAAGRRTPTTTMHEHLVAKVAVVGKRLGWLDLDPTPIVYWNLRNTGGHPVAKDTEGTVLLAGFSPSLLKLILNGEALSEETVEVVAADGSVTTQKIKATPEQILRKMLDDEAYDPVREVLASSVEGALAEYELVEQESVML